MSAQFKGSVTNRNITPPVTAKVVHVGPNDYRVMLESAGFAGELEFKQAAHFGVAYGKAIYFSTLSADDAAFEIHKAQALLRAQQ